LEDEEFRRRFHSESQAVAMLSHPNIVSIYDVSTSITADYIVMELIDGITLKQYMEKKGVLNWKETLHFAIQIAKALEHAHGRGIVHRDIKPHNVMVLKNGSVKVADFGIAQVASTNTTTLTKEALGSVHYISPEQAKGGRVDNRSDLYSLGIVMYEMIAGRVPYDGDTPVNIAIQHINGGAQRPSQYNPNIPQGLEQIIQKAMALAPRDRYMTATDMLYDMDEFRKDPTMVFEAREQTVDGATRAIPTELAAELAAQKPKTIAERTAEGRTEPSGPKKEVRRQPPRPLRIEDEDDEEEGGRSRVTTIAIASCVVVGIVALIIFFVLLAQGGLFSKANMVEVPSLIGQNYETLREYAGIKVVRQGGEYSEEYEKGEIIYQYPLAGDKVVSGTKVFVKISLGKEPPAKTMEDLVNLKAEEAEKFLNGLNMGLHVIPREENSATIPAGYVTRTSPAEGTPLSEGQTITIWISTGPQVIFEQMRDVVGMSVDNALAILKANGFSNVHENPVDSDRPKGEVVNQSVAKYERIDVTTLIVLDVSTGVPEIPIEPPTSGDTKPSQPSDPESDEPEPSPPEDQPLTLDYVFVLPSRTESYVLSIQLNGEWFLEGMTIQPGATTAQVRLTGHGTQSYDLYIDGVYYATETVEFEPDD
jgi:serine/threonine-protein kinase